MRTALLDGKTVHAADLTWGNKKYIYTCPECGKDLRLVVSSTEHYPSHFRHRYRESCGTHTYVKQHTPEECEDFQERSDINALRMSGGDIYTLTTSQRRRLREHGLIRQIHRGGSKERYFTERGLVLLGEAQKVID